MDEIDKACLAIAPYMFAFDAAGGLTPAGRQALQSQGLAFLTAHELKLCRAVVLEVLQSIGDPRGNPPDNVLPIDLTKATP